MKLITSDEKYPFFKQKAEDSEDFVDIFKEKFYSIIQVKQFLKFIRPCYVKTKEIIGTFAVIGIDKMPELD